MQVNQMTIFNACSRRVLQVSVSKGSEAVEKVGDAERFVGG
jgi:hypothetical protein